MSRWSLNDIRYIMAAMGADGQPNTFEQFVDNLDQDQTEETKVEETPSGYKHDPGKIPHRKKPLKIVVPAKSVKDFEDHAKTIAGCLGIGA